MKSWTSPAALRERVMKEWDKGSLPACILGGASLFPLRLNLQGPDSGELAERFDEVRAWISSLSEAESSPGFRLEWKDINHRQLGRNSVPIAAIFDDAEDALAFVNKRRDAARLQSLARTITAAFPSLDDWVRRRALLVMERDRDWPVLLEALAWFRSHPHSGLYARQIDAPGVHSKFVEGNRGLLAELLDLVLLPESIDWTATGASGFARRYGLRDRPLHVRLRILDPGLNLNLSFGHCAASAGSSLRVDELTLLAEDFAKLLPPHGGPEHLQVFITENEINFLSFPFQEGGLIIFGAGYGFAALAQAEWLRRYPMRYWGDLDTHGFAILDQLRARFPDAASLLMDRATLLAHRELWTSEGSPSKADLGRLLPEEKELYDNLRFDRLAPALRLEQERIGFFWLEEALKNWR